ncbi:nucleotide sugar dehydrogenase, partial [Xanthomonas hortorum pv. gardneri]
MSRTTLLAPLQAHIAVIGLGYVGLPLAVSFGEQRGTPGFYIAAPRGAQVRGGPDPPPEPGDTELDAATRVRYTQHPSRLCAR